MTAAATGLTGIATIRAALDRAEAVLQADVARARAQADAIKESADAYVAATERSLVARFLAHNGMAVPPDREHEDIALDLLALVESLPEHAAAPKPASPRAAAAPKAAPAAPPAPLPEAPPALAAQHYVPPPDAAGPPPARWLPHVGAPAVLEPAPAAGRFPAVERASLDRALLFFGGIPEAAKLDRWRALIGPEARVEWVECYQDRHAEASAAIGRMRRGDVLAVVVATDFIAHAWSDKIKHACRAGRAPFYMAGKLSAHLVAEALETLERRLAGEAAQ